MVHHQEVMIYWIGFPFPSGIMICQNMNSIDVTPLRSQTAFVPSFYRFLDTFTVLILKLQQFMYGHIVWNPCSIITHKSYAYYPKHIPQILLLILLFLYIP